MPKHSLFGWSRNGNIDARGRNGPLFNVVPESADGPAEIVMYGDVFKTAPVDWMTGKPVEGQCIALDEMTKRIDDVKDASEIVIRLNSSGGDANSGVAIHNQLRGFSGKKTVIVEGMAASAASIIMCAGDEIKVHPSSEVLIHNPAAFLCDYYTLGDLETVLGEYKACVKQLKAVYAERTGRNDEELQELIDASTWLVGQEIVDEGFADEVVEPARKIEPPQVVDNGDAVLIAGVRHQMYNLANVPAWLTGGDKGRDAIEDRVEPTHEGVEVDITNAEQLRAAYPDFVAELINAATETAVAEATATAVANERKRFRDIDSIAATIDSEMVNRAKYEEPMTAQELAFAAVQAQAKTGAEILAATDRDRKDSGVCNVDPDPNDPNEDEDDPDDEREMQNVIASAVQLYNKAKATNAKAVKGVE